VKHKSTTQPSGGLAKTMVAITTLAMANTALPCTRVLWNSGNGHVIVGRTQDWTEKANSAFRVYPRGIERTGAVAENPHKWTSKYGSLALSAYDMGPHEGVNEKGLSAHALYLAVEAQKSFAFLLPVSHFQFKKYPIEGFLTLISRS